MAGFLLDTHVFLWWVNDSPELTAKVRKVISDIDNDCFFSMASCWELAIKASLGKLSLSKPVERFVSEQILANGFVLLDITLHHASTVEKLPFYQRDPFDRLLAAQAMAEKLTLISADRVFAKYGAKVLW